MVAIASMLNSASTLMTMDVVKQLNPQLTDAQVVRIGRASTIGMLVIAVAWATELPMFPSLWQYLQAVLAYAVPPVVAVFLLGMFWRGANADGAAAAMLFGSLGGLSLFAVNVLLGWTHFHFLYAAPILTLLDGAILIVVSRMRGASPAVSSEVSLWRIDFSGAERGRLGLTPWWQDFRFQAAVLLALTAAVVIAFR
jgi:SSS family solute:Na+ symporter